MDEQHGGQRIGRPAAFIAHFGDMGSANRERYRRALYLREGRQDAAGRWRHRMASKLLLPGPQRADPQRTGVRWPRRCDWERKAGRWWDRTPSSTLLADIPPPRPTSKCPCEPDGPSCQQCVVLARAGMAQGGCAGAGGARRRSWHRPPGLAGDPARGLPRCS